MSTGDSQLLLASDIVADNLPFIRRLSYSISARLPVLLGRLLLVLIGFAAGLHSMYFPGPVSNLIRFGWGGMGAAFEPVKLLSLY